MKKYIKHNLFFYFVTHTHYLLYVVSFFLSKSVSDWKNILKTISFVFVYPTKLEYNKRNNLTYIIIS